MTEDIDIDALESEDIDLDALEAEANGTGSDIDIDALEADAEESEFQRWYAGHAQARGLNSNPDSPEHFYDYRAAWRAGAGPDETGHWPSQFKRAGHPNLIIDGIDSRTGLPVASLADLAGVQGEAGADWSNVTPGNAAGTALRLGAGVLTGGMSLLSQVGANLAAGAAERYLTGNDVLDPLGLGLDLAIPMAGSVVRGLARGRAAKLMDDLGDATDIKSWRDLPAVEITNPTARPLREAGVLERTRDLYRSPVTVGGKSGNESIRTLARRMNLYPRAEARLDQEVERVLSVIPKQHADDVTLLLSGHRTAADVAPEAVEASQHLRRFYDDMGELGERWKVSTVGTDKGQRIYKPFQREQNYFGPLVSKATGQPAEAVESLAEATGVERGARRTMHAFERTTTFNPLHHETDARKLLAEWRRRYVEPYASTYSFGPRPNPALATEGTQEFGEAANELLSRAAAGPLSGQDEVAHRLLRGSLEQIYQRPALDFWDDALSAGGRAAATAYLPQSWARQFLQIAPTIGRTGLDNFVEGLVRYRRDPGFRELIRASGAQRPSMAQQLAEIGMDTDSNLVGRSIGWAEDKLRGPLSAGTVPYIEQTLARAASGEASSGLARQMAEMGVEMGPAYTPTADLVRDAYSQLVGRTQLLSSSAGQSSKALIGRPLSRALTQFKPYSLGAARLFRDDYLAPIGSGLANLGRGGGSDLALGLERLLRLAPAAVGAGALADTLTGAQSLSLPQILTEPGRSFERAAKVNIGMPADLAFEAMHGRNPLGSLVPPVSDIMGDSGPLSLGIGALSLRNPQLASSLSLAQPAIRNWTPKEYKWLTR